MSAIIPTNLPDISPKMAIVQMGAGFEERLDESEDNTPGVVDMICDHYCDKLGVMRFLEHPTGSVSVSGSASLKVEIYSSCEQHENCTIIGVE